MPTIPDLETQAKDFANKITNIVQCFDDNAKAFKVDILGKEKTHSATVEIYNDDGFSLFTNKEPNFHIEAQWTCRYDAYGQWLRVERSGFKVFNGIEDKRPIFRYEYDSANGQNLPSAHIHFHGDHPDMNQHGAFDNLSGAFEDCGDGSPRSKRRQKGKKKKLSDLHFPVGGSRFRPILEDVLLMLIEEYGINPEKDRKETIKLLEENVEKWRTIQAQTIVRDVPSIVVNTLKEMGYTITPPLEGVKPDRREYLTQR